MQRSKWTEPMLILLAVLVPLAGLVLAVLELSRGERALAFRIGAATVLGIFLYALLLG